MTLRLFIKLTQKEEANTFLSGMIEKWKKNYPKVTQSLIENQDLLTFMIFHLAFVEPFTQPI
jgi:transposase-like protein